MPVFVDNQKREYFLSQKKELIDRDLLDCYNRLMEKQNPESVIRSHKLCINRMDIHGRNKYKTLRLLEHYRNTEDKSIALSVLTSSLNSLGIFSMFSSDEERKNRRWTEKGLGQKC
jgi:hypothetical protein